MGRERQRARAVSGVVRVTEQILAIILLLFPNQNNTVTNTAPSTGLLLQLHSLSLLTVPARLIYSFIPRIEVCFLSLTDYDDERVTGASPLHAPLPSAPSLPFPSLP